MLKFRGSKFSRIAVFLSLVEFFWRILKHATPTLTYGCGYFMSCVHLLLSQIPTFEVEAMVRGYNAYQDSIDRRGACVC